MSAASKRQWRLKNPERYTRYERERAQRRRDEPFPAGSRYGEYAQKNSYYRYEARREAARVEKIWKDFEWAAYLRGEIPFEDTITDEMRALHAAVCSLSSPRPRFLTPSKVPSLPRLI